MTAVSLLRLSIMRTLTVVPVGISGAFCALTSSGWMTKRPVNIANMSEPCLKFICPRRKVLDGTGKWDAGSNRMAA
jgi:hypothetical protein